MELTGNRKFIGGTETKEDMEDHSRNKPRERRID